MSRPRTRLIKKCLYCSKEFEVIPSALRQGAGKHCSDECRRIDISIHKKTRKEIWTKYNQKRNKDVVRLNHEKHKFDSNATIINKVCVACGSKNMLVIHHKDGNNGRLGKSLNNQVNNLVVLCKSCHPKYHSRWGLKEVMSYEV